MDGDDSSGQLSAAISTAVRKRTRKTGRTARRG
jgi:hypothetical protein